MNPFGRVVIGYHGCPSVNAESIEFLRGILAGTQSITEWRQSDNVYDWLGNGVYFWEYGPNRARQWAGDDGIVVGALIQLGRCFDLTDPGNTEHLRRTYEDIAAYRGSQ